MVQRLMDQSLVRHDNWLLLTDYASKYRISVSTLRRRIKSDQIKHRLEHGRYFIYDEVLSAPRVESTPPPKPAPQFHAEARDSRLGMAQVATPALSPEEIQIQHQMNGLKPGDAPILSSATRLLNELKRAYTNILQEKEEQLIQLKEEVSDLKTLVRVLESDNDRLRRLSNTSMNPGFDRWDQE